jgi:flagellar motility protein MotE (MotC chaperone)
MNRVRLLPIVIVAASGLMVLKATALITHGDKILAQEPGKPINSVEDLPRFARALAKLRFGTPSDDGLITGSVDDKKKDAAKADPAKPKADTPKPDAAKPDAGKPATPPAAAQPASDAQRPPQQNMPPPVMPPSERAVLERLQERRGAIDDRTREIELRENMLRAAERKVDDRINELKEVEGRLDAGARAEQAEAEKQMKMLVVMYENMKPKDAAKIFDRLNLQVLIPIATAMKPARMSEILAAMSPEAAEKLTVALASRARDPGAGMMPGASATTPAGELPRIDRPVSPVGPSPAPQPPRR